ncbi:Asp23/Gls24 family envelope stress response protein [Fodinicola feengrottensis]|uniref:Asp23/Gls24 family envelope stress response protein n=1 Tax=Fodinicola feengrottensis TaxID=435914 RepID=A0ABN2I129_9ACTN|nr:Asp23/Gls24 family envelope stress response protein [Fodinicola feengrottensis]
MADNATVAKEAPKTTAAPAVRTQPHGTAAIESLTGPDGRTSIADGVVQKIAGIATREISGVHDLGGSFGRALGALRDRIPGGATNITQGVAVEVGERQTAVDLNIVVEYGVSIADLAVAIRRNVIQSVERMTGLEVTEVNVAVNDIHIPGEESEPEQTRVQ